MLITSFFKWWYTDGFRNELLSIVKRTQYAANAFSVPILLKTLFDPWKQVITPQYGDTALDETISNAISNLVSRFVGFWIRIFTLIAASIFLTIVVIYGILRIIIWPVLPLLPIVLITIGVTR